MDDKIRELLIAKSQKLAEGMNVRCQNVVAWMLKDVDNRLIPLMKGEADLLRVPLCGVQTAAHIRPLLREVNTFYNKLLESPSDAPLDSVEADALLTAGTEKKPFSFSRQNNRTERKIQFIYEQMAEQVNDTRARNLIHHHLKNYKKTEKYINNHSLIRKWHGAGRQTVEQIILFLEHFRDEYPDIVLQSAPSRESAKIGKDYPFLTADELSFVASFFRNHGRYPTLFIAQCYFRRPEDRPSKIFARVNGVLGHFDSPESLAEEYGLTAERIRQISRPRGNEKNPSAAVWNSERWMDSAYFHLPLLTKESARWEEVCKEEHLGRMDFYAGLSILALVRPIDIIPLMYDGCAANGRRRSHDTWEQPDVLFAIDHRLNGFRFAACIKSIVHEANLQRMDDRTLQLEAWTIPYFQSEPSDAVRAEIYDILKDILPRFLHIQIEGDSIILRANRTNYVQDIYQILKHKGEPMTVDDIFTEFMRQHPTDHHTDGTFIRSYMLMDPRFEAIGRKSTYQLCEWKRFSGALGELAVELVRSSEEPMPLSELIQKMMEQRQSTTQKSCETSVYLAFRDGKLQYFMTDDSPTTTAYVGLADRVYPSCYWLSTISLENSVSSLRRFVKEFGRWPFSSKKVGLEASLYYVVRKYIHRLHVTEEELQRFWQAMADMPFYLYPRNLREVNFLKKCNELSDFLAKHHRLPESQECPQLQKWFRETKAKQPQLDQFRAHHFQAVFKVLKAQRGEQLTLDFE